MLLLIKHQSLNVENIVLMQEFILALMRVVQKIIKLFFIYLVPIQYFVLYAKLYKTHL